GGARRPAPPRPRTPPHRSRRPRASSPWARCHSPSPPALQPLGGADKQRAEMAKKLFVGNLAYGITEDELRELFAQAGTCESVSIVTDRDTGQSRGFAFVTMASAEDAERAKEQPDGPGLKGRRPRLHGAADPPTPPRVGRPVRL